MDPPDKEVLALTNSQTVEAVRESEPSTESSQIEQINLGETFAERYEILELLGKGGNGSVYRVRHFHLDKCFALKVISSADSRDTDSIRRFQQEAKFGTRLDHPGIVRVHDFGVHKGKPYMVMDFFNGESLSQLIKKRELTPERLLKVAELVLNALAHAHDRSIIHRDIKPSNILVGKDANGEDQVTLVDLGIAKELNRQAPQDMIQTKTGEIFGTPLYMSPEQCSGIPVDARTDIYSLGCVLYEALTGSPPFLGETIFEIINKHVNDAPARFPLDIRQTQLGSRMEAIVLKALAKDKEHRYQFALEMAIELKQIALHQSSIGTNLKFYWKLFSGRMNAVQRGKVLSSWLMCLLSVCAIVISSLVFYLLPQIKSEFKELKRNASISGALSSGNIGASNSLDRTEIDSMQRKLGKIKLLSQSDPEQLNRALRYEKDYLAAVDSTRSFVDTAKLSFQTMSVDTLQRLFENLPTIAQPWTNESKSRALIYGYSYQKYKQAADQLAFHLAIFSLLPWAGTACVLALFFLILQRLRSKYETKKAYSKALDNLHVDDRSKQPVCLPKEN